MTKLKAVEEFIKSIESGEFHIGDFDPALIRRLCALIDAGILRRLESALKPFAAMHREGCDEGEVACERGTAIDRTMITSGDFKRAADALKLADKATK